MQLTEKLKKVDTFFGQFWLIWTCFLVIPQFVVDGIFQSNGYLFAYTGYYWIMHAVLLFLGILISKWYASTLTKFGSLFLAILEGYIFFRYLQPETWYFNPYIVILDVIMVGLMIFQIFWTLFALSWNLIAHLRFGANNSRSKKFSISLSQQIHNGPKSLGFLALLIIVLSVMLPFATSGFGASITIVDEGNTIQRVGFWDRSWRGLNVSLYTDEYAIDELEKLQEINAFLMFQIHKEYLENPTLYSQFTDLVHLYESYDIEIVMNANPKTWVQNENTGEWEQRGDYVTYHHTEIMNETIDLIINWIKAENFTNVIGLSFDTEGPVYETANMTISKEQYNAAKYSYNEKLKEFKTEFPDMETMQISMEFTFWDLMDSDSDLSIRQLTVDYDANFDKFGYMTYQLSTNPDYSSYSYYVSMVQGQKVHGSQFQPWLGWIGDYEAFDDENFNRTFWEQLKIAKNFAGEEIIIGYYPTFVGKDHQTTLERLDQLGKILYSEYDPVEIKISHRKWNDNIFPTYWMISGAIFEDMINGDNLPWYNILESGIIFAGIALIYWKKKDKKRIPAD